MKTEQLFKKYYRLLREQDPAGGPQDDLTGAAPDPNSGAGVGGQPDQTQQPAPEPEPGSKIDNNEKHVIKILTNAFIFNPSLFDKNKQKFIVNKIDTLTKSVNVPVAKLVQDLKSIIALDTSLRVESKTLKMLKGYMLMYEKELDATDLPPPDAQTSSPGPQAQQPAKSNQNALNLTEIFPLYKELILKALKHVPTDEELMIIKPIVNEFADIDPEKIVVTIQNLLNQSTEDDEIEGALGDA